MQSVLDFSQKRVNSPQRPQQHVQPPEVYSPTSNVSLSPTTDRQPRSLSGKRKHTDVDPLSEPVNKTRRLNPEDEFSHSSPSSTSPIVPTARERIRHDPTRADSMTTVVCLHAAVAQKSYGSEKRFLCPPPSVRIEGYPAQMLHQNLTMTITAETGERASTENVRLDDDLNTNFKHLHVGNSSRAKHFTLSLDIADPFMLPSPSQKSPEEPRRLASRNRVWAHFDSAPVTIISKPSKKTAKTRNIQSCILAGGPVSLFNRINAQTVRTKYLTIDGGNLAASNNHWSAFTMTVLRRPPAEGPHIGGPEPVVYGSEVDLMDQQTGFSTGRLLIRKVDKGRVLTEDGGPVSQMQKVALQRINADGTRSYLSAAGPQQPTLNGNMSVSSTSGTVSGSIPVHSSSISGTHSLTYVPPRVKEEVVNGQQTEVDDIDDFVCWTIVGISKFQYTFFDHLNRHSTPTELITPFPTLFTTPVFRPTTNTLELTVSNFFYKDPKTEVSHPLDIWLGDIGPLRHRVYHSLNPPASGSSFAAPPLQASTSTDPSTSSASVDVTAGAPAATTSGSSSRANHTVVIVDMPAVAEIIACIRDAVPLEPPRPTAAPADDNAPSPTSPTSPVIPLRPDMRALEPLLARGLPIFFIRPTDGTGYHAGHAVACENILQTLNIGGEHGISQAWMAAAQAAHTDGSTYGWTLRVV